MPGTNWIALAPVPSTAIRLPRRSTVWSHSAEWKEGPSKLSRRGGRGWPAGTAPHGGDEHVGLDRLGRGRGHPPGAAVVVVRRGGDLHAGPDQVEHALLARPYARCSRGSRPAGSSGAATRGWARTTRSRARTARRTRRWGRCSRARPRLTPSACSRIEDVRVAGLPQLDGRAEAAEACADDRDRGLPAHAGQPSRRRPGQAGVSVIVASSSRPCWANLCSTSTS